MNSKEIRQLIEIVSRSNVSRFELEQEGFRIKLVKGPSGGKHMTTTDVVAAPAPGTEAHLAAAPSESAPVNTNGPAASAADSGLVTLTSPIVGTFYSSPSPDAASFVQPGSRVSKGQVVCIVEAMKVMNEIESEINAEVVEVLVSNGQPVEFGEELFRLRPS